MNLPNFSEHKKIFAVVIVLMLLLIGLFALRYQRTNSLKKALENQKANITVVNSPPPASLTGSYKIELSAPTVKAGENVLAKVIFEAAGKQIIGSDVILKFDPSFLEASQGSELGDYFTSYPRKSVDNTGGVMKISGFGAKNSQPVTSPVTFFTVSFKTKKAGSTSLLFDFTVGKTNTTTLVEKGTSKNILREAKEATVVIEP